MAIRLAWQLIGRPHSYHSFYSQETIFNGTVYAAAAATRSQAVERVGYHLHDTGR
jgi:hypothetical protein